MSNPESARLAIRRLYRMVHWLRQNPQLSKQMPDELPNIEARIDALTNAYKVLKSKEVTHGK